MFKIGALNLTFAHIEENFQDFLTCLFKKCFYSISKSIRDA
jgi:hypothetical protein